MQTPEPNRLFFALLPSEDVRARIAATADFLCTRHSLRGHRNWPQLYHLTLFFLGDHVPAATEAAALKAAARIEAPPFTLCLDKTGSFANIKIPIWLGASTPPAELKFLDRALRKTLRGLPHERQPGYAPHLTILRDAEKLLPEEPIQPIEWPVGEFVLIRSIQRSQPVRYEVLERFPLRGAPLKPEPKQVEMF